MFLRNLQSGSGKAMSFGKNKAKMLTEAQNKHTFADVAGCDEASASSKRSFTSCVTPKFTRLGGKLPKGVLLMGSPGTGKTLLAKAVAGEAKVPFFTISGSDFVEMFVGVGASRVRDLFEQAKARRASSLSTKSTPSGATEAPAWVGARRARADPQSACSSRWTGSRRTRASSSWRVPTDPTSWTLRCCAQGALIAG